MFQEEDTQVYIPWIWCVEWYDKDNERHIQWGVPQPEEFKDDLIKQGMNPEKIDVYLKDVS